MYRIKFTITLPFEISLHFDEDAVVEWCWLSVYSGKITEGEDIL